MSDVEVHDNPERSRVEAFLGDEVAGFAAYRDRDPRTRIFTHTEVRPEYEGQGIAAALARSALDQARREGLRVVPMCPYIRDWIERHPGYADLVTT